MLDCVFLSSGSHLLHTCLTYMSLTRLTYISYIHVSHMSYIHLLHTCLTYMSHLHVSHMSYIHVSYIHVLCLASLRCYIHVLCLASLRCSLCLARLHVSSVDVSSVGFQSCLQGYALAQCSMLTISFL